MNKLFKYYILLFFIMVSSLVYAQDTDIYAFKLNQTQKFSTKDHPKAKGINISLEYPINWEAKEGERPNIVKKFSRALENGSSVICLVVIKDLPSQIKILSDEDIAKEMFSEEVIKSMFPGNSKLLEHIHTKYDGQQGALSSFATVGEQSGLQLYSVSLQHIFIYSKKIICIRCTVGGLLKNSREIEELYINYFPLFLQIGNSIVINDKWNKK